MKLEIEEIKKLKINPGDTLVVTVDITHCTRSQVTKYLDNVKDFFKKFLDSENLHTTKVIVMPKEVQIEKILS